VNVAKRTRSNTSGTYRATRRNIMAAFDQLPREVRDALNGANLPFAPQRLRTMLRRGASAAEAVQAVRDADRRETARTQRG
jgi:predicted RNase H-like nuclease (RuvC/YqgF family)